MKVRSLFKEKEGDVFQSERGWKHTHTQTHALKKKSGDTHKDARTDVDSGKLDCFLCSGQEDKKSRKYSPYSPRRKRERDAGKGFKCVTKYDFISC